MYKEKISVIVTLYNRLEYARNMILSLINQTLMIDELIFADDGSKEDVADIIKDLIDKCPFEIKCVYQEDIGFRLARSRNNGARAATGEFLIFLDQDVIMPDDFIEKVFFARNEKRIVSVRGYLTSEKEKYEIQKMINKKYNYQNIYSYVYNKKSDKFFKNIIRKDILYRFLYKIKFRTRGTKMVGLMFALYKKDYIAINGFDDNYKGWGKEDDDFCNRFYKYGGEVYPLKLKEYLLHMYHPFSSTKAESLNENYYQQRKQEINKRKFKCLNGYENSIDKDEVRIKYIK